MIKRLIITTMKEDESNPDVLVRDNSHHFIVGDDLQKPYTLRDFRVGLREMLDELIYSDAERLEVMIFSRSNVYEEEKE